MTERKKRVNEKNFLIITQFDQNYMFSLHNMYKCVLRTKSCNYVIGFNL